MEFKFIEKSLYSDIAPASFELGILHAKARADLLPPTEIMTKKQFNKRIKIKGFIGIAAYEGNVLCGYCFCRIKSFTSQTKAKNKLLWIDEFFVCEPFRRNGCGRMLFEEIKRVAKEKSCSIIEFDVWDFNETAKRFYDSVGCKSQRIIKEYVL